MKIRTFLTLWVLLCLSLTEVQAQNLEWALVNVHNATGERVVAVLEASSITEYTGVTLTGQLIDHNGNWGYTNPTVANFSVFVRFSGGISSAIIQDLATSNIKLRLRQVSTNKVHLIAECPVAHSSAYISLKKTVGWAVAVSLGDPNIINSSGTLICNEPTYRSGLSGTVNIGSNAIASALNVNGNIRAKEVKVETANWPDYVFGEDYLLQPLSEVESFINEAGHLPGIPSAEQVALEGVDLGEMNRILLEKIEELTLYLIQERKARLEMDKRILALMEGGSGK